MSFFSYARALYKAVFRRPLLIVPVFLSFCAGPVRETAPGPDFPAIAPYDLTEALIPHPIDERKDIRVHLHFDAGIDEGLKLRIIAFLSQRQNTSGPLSPWPAVFSETEGPSFSHRLLFRPAEGGVAVTAFELVAGKEKELQSIQLSLAEPAKDDGGVHIEQSGRAVVVAHGYPDLADDSRKMLLALAERLGTGTLRITSPSRADVFLKENGGLLPLGATPVDVQIRSGIREIVIRRQGQPEQRKSVRVPDGGERMLMAAWSDDSDPGSALIFTSPDGYRLALDGEVIGEAPVARPGVIAGVYELEIAEKSGEQDFRVVTVDRLQVSGGRRVDRFYPFEYHLAFRGASLKSALESGLWSYTSSDQRFYIADFDRPALSVRSGLSSIPIGAERLQLEAILPDQSASFGLYSEGDRFLIEPSADDIRLRLEIQGKVQVYTFKREQGRQIYIFADLDRTQGTLALRINGKSFYDGAFTVPSAVRLISIGSQAGTKPPEEILLRSGTHTGGMFFRAGRFFWYEFKSMSGSPLRLREDDKSKGDR